MKPHGKSYWKVEYERRNVMSKMKLSPPWITFVNRVKGLFNGDPDIHIQYDEEEYALKLFVDDEEKADALMKLLPPQKEFGNVVLKISVIPADNGMDYLELFRAAFKGNPNVTDIVSVEDPFGTPLNFVVFKKEVIQFYNDDISDLHGVCSTLNEISAREVFGSSYDTVNFCTDVPREVVNVSCKLDV